MFVHNYVFILLVLNFFELIFECTPSFLCPQPERKKRKADEDGLDGIDGELSLISLSYLPMLKS